jgi:hypothetical protein
VNLAQLLKVSKITSINFKDKRSSKLCLRAFFQLRGSQVIQLENPRWTSVKIEKLKKLGDMKKCLENKRKWRQESKKENYKKLKSKFKLRKNKNLMMIPHQTRKKLKMMSKVYLLKRKTHHLQ